MTSRHVISKVVRSEKGFGLVEVLVAGAVGAVTMVAMNSMMISQYKAQRNLASSTNFDSAFAQMRNYLSYQSNCSTILNGNPKLNTALSGGLAPTENFPVPQIPATSPKPIFTIGQAPSGEYTVDSMVLKNFLADTAATPPHPDNFTVDLAISATRKGTPAGTGGLFQKLPIYITTTTAGANRFFQSCTLAGTSSASCPPGQYMTGMNSNGTPNCGSAIELRTSDPTSPYSGQTWLRTDL